MKSKLIIGIGISVLFSGCIMWDAGYTDNTPVIETRISVEDKVPISYDVILDLDRNDIIAAPEMQELRDKIEEGLKATGLFSEVLYGKGTIDDSYHVSFLFRQAGMTVEDSMAVGLLAGYTFFLVPIIAQDAIHAAQPTAPLLMSVGGTNEVFSHCPLIHLENVFYDMPRYH